MVGLPFAPGRDGVRVAVRLTPKAGANRIIGLIEDGRGGCAIKASVTAPAVDGKANAALVKLLAKHFGLKSRDLAIVGGSHGRAKLVQMQGDPVALASTLKEGLRPWLQQS
jgi:uncharacterized protein (TIGR00251 family)